MPEESQSENSADLESGGNGTDLDLKYQSKLTEFYESQKSFKRKLKTEIIKSVLIVGFLLTFFVFGLTYATLSTRGDDQYVKRMEMHEILLAAIEKGADLRAIKNIYENRPIHNKTFFMYFSRSTDNYPIDAPISRILEDLRSTLFTSNQSRNMLLDPINKLIVEHNERNPFDALESNQKDYFENIRTKSNQNYPIIRGEVDKLATELETKNALVNKYLNRSNTSFWISIVALAFSLGIGLFQILQNRRQHDLTSSLCSQIDAVVSVPKPRS